jgi:hypothetical protein
MRMSIKNLDLNQRDDNRIEGLRLLWKKVGKMKNNTQ